MTNTSSLDNELPESLNGNVSEPSYQWTLVATNGRLSGQSYPLKPGVNLIGRDPDCDLRIAGTALSRHHARMVAKHDEVIIADLSSNQATYVDDVAVERMPLKEGARVRFDVHSFVLHRNDPDNQSAPVPPLTSTSSTTTDNQRWLTKPTSPGNREEPEAKPHGVFISLLSGLILMVALAGLAYVMGWIS